MLHVCEESVCAMYGKPGSSINDDLFSSWSCECYTSFRQQKVLSISISLEFPIKQVPYLEMSSCIRM